MINTLSARECQLIEFASNGLTDQEIATKLGLSRYTVNSYWKRLFLKLDVPSRAAAVFAYSCIKGSNIGQSGTSLQQIVKTPRFADKTWMSLIRDISELSMKVLDSLMTQLEASYGFVGTIRINEEGTPYIKVLSITDLSWDDTSKKLYALHSSGNLEFRNLDTLFGEVVKTKRVVISEDPSSDPRSGGLPAGHVPFENFFGVPITFQGELVGVACFANRSSGFKHSLADDIFPFLEAFGAALHVHRELESKDLSLKNAEDCTRILISALEDSRDGVLITDSDGKILYANAEFCRLLHISVPADCLRNLQWRALLPNVLHLFDNPADITEYIEQCFASEICDASVDGSFKDGEDVLIVYRQVSRRTITRRCWIFRSKKCPPNSASYRGTIARDSIPGFRV